VTVWSWADFEVTEVQDANRIREVAMDFDNAIEARDIEQMVEAFADDCEIELMGITLQGKEGARRWSEWLFGSVPNIVFKPIIIMVEGNVFFEEFLVSGTLPNGEVVESKQSEILVYENYKIKSLRLYFDRLDFADLVAPGFFSKKVVDMLKSRSLKGLV
jgi:ketosteroid isomerase-like protein